MGEAVTGLIGDLSVEAGITSDQLAELRSALYEDGRIDDGEARRLLHLHRHGFGATAGEEWADFFVGALVDFYALQRETPDWGVDYKPDFGRAAANAVRALSPVPAHKATAPDFAWSDVKAELSDDAVAALTDAFQAEGGLVLDAAERRILARLFERAVDYPTSLVNFALTALHVTVVADGCITADEVDLLRSVLYGPGGDDAIAIARSEAAALFAIKDACRDGENADAWPDLFVKAITMHLLFGGGSPEAVDAAEARWLALRLSADGDYDDVERALIAYIKKEAQRVDPAIERLAA